MDNKDKRIDNTIGVIESVLEKNKDNKNVKEAYEDLIKLKERRAKRIQ